MTVLYLVRHAHSAWSLDDDRPLSSAGQEAAERVAEVLASRPLTAIHASSERRARQTVEPLAVEKGLPVQPEDGLRERRLMDVETADFRAAVKRTWDEPDFAYPGGESNATARRRGLEVVRRIVEQHPDGEVVVGTHGNLLALVLQHFDPSVGFDFWESLTMPDIIRFEVEGDKLEGWERVWEESS
ncbi:MAG: histidine phosphatase family protein [Thermoanaerobaculia bacterium]